MRRIGVEGYKPSKKVIARSGIALAGTVVLVLLIRICEGNPVEKITKIERNGYGEGVKSEELCVQIEGEEERAVVLEISPRIYSDEEIEKLFSKAAQELEKLMLGTNEDFLHITEDLYLPNELEEYPFQILWQFSDYDVIDMNGKIKQEQLREMELADQGVDVSVHITLRYEQNEQTFDVGLVIYPSQEDELTIEEKVLESVTWLNTESKEEKYMELPSEIDGKKIVWLKKREQQEIVLLVIGSTISVLLIGLDRQKILEAQKEKKEQMLFDYPEIVSQIIILMGAGMTAKNTWRKMTEDYQEQRRNSGKIRWAYEEIEFTLKEMNNGIPELECYERFAKRCDLMPYAKLGTLLAQNLKKGTKGLWVQLEMEARQAMNDRKNQVKRLGEEASTKLLLPMLLMLIVVMLIVIVPAFLSIQI